MQATTTLGIPYVEDLNDPSQPAYGCTKMHYTMDSNGRRSSALTAFLPAHLVSSRSHNLHVCTPVIVQRIDVSSNSGEVSAEGVWVQSSTGGPSRLVRAKRQVILTAGPVNSPQMLMLRLVNTINSLTDA